MGIIAQKKTRFGGAVSLLAILTFSRGGVAGPQGRGPEASAANAVLVGALAVPAKARNHLDKARRASLKDDDDEYRRELAAALAIYPHYAEAYLLRASHELLHDSYDAAIDAALTAQRYEPSIHWATMIHAIACNQLHQFEEAATLLDGLGPAEMDTWQAIFEKARAAVGTRDTEAALHWSERALRTVPENRLDESLLLRGDALLLAHRWSEAVLQFQAYLSSPRPQTHRAEVLALLARIPSLAKGDAAEMIAADPQ